MNAIKIDRDGTITQTDGPDEAWMTDDVVWAEIEYPGQPGHAIYYDDDAMEDPGMVRVLIAGAEVPLPVFVVGIDGERTCAPTLSSQQIKQDLRLPS